jgi:hypothetical protein
MTHTRFSPNPPCDLGDAAYKAADAAAFKMQNPFETAFIGCKSLPA